MRLGDLSPREARSLFEGPGLTLSIGPFDIAFRSRLHPVQESLRRLYAAFPVRTEPTIIDFHLGLEARRRLTSGWRRQVECRINGRFCARMPGGRLAPMLAEWGLNLCIGTRAHRFLILHAAVVERGGLALVMPAAPGAGKSTLCAALVLDGWRLLSDEICLLQPEDGAVAPLPRPIALKGRSIALIGSRRPGAAMGPLIPDTAKGDLQHLLPFEEHVRSQQQRAMPAWLLFPRWRPGAAGALAPLAPDQAFMGLLRNAMNYDVMAEDGFRTALRLVETTECYGFEYDGLDQALDRVNRLASGIDERSGAWTASVSLSPAC